MASRQQELQHVKPYASLLHHCTVLTVVLAGFRWRGDSLGEYRGWLVAGVVYLR